MDDTRRFLRYVIPGLIFGIELIFLLWLLTPALVNESKLVGLTEGTGFALIASSVIASGGLGLIFSSIHHLIHWKLGGAVVDHRPYLKKLVKSGSLYLADVGISKKDHNNAKETAQIKFIDNISCEESWIIFTAIWHQLTLDSESENVYRKFDSLCTLAHSLGTSRVSALFAGLIAFTIAFRCSQTLTWVSCGLAVLTSILIVWLFHTCYIHTARFARAFSDVVLENRLENIRENNDNHAFDVCVGSLKSVFKVAKDGTLSEKSKG